MRMLARFYKDQSICEISHLDTLRAVQRAIRRAQIPVQYSQGFHPHMNIAFASALGVGLSSEAEWMDVPLSQEMEESTFEALLAPQMPAGMKLCEAHAVDDRYPALMSITAWADYNVCLSLTDQRSVIELQEIMEQEIQNLENQPVMAMKKSKKGIQEVDIQPMLSEVQLVAITEVLPNTYEVEMQLRCVHAPDGALNPLLFLPIFEKRCQMSVQNRQVVRKAMWGEKEKQPVPIWTLPKKPMGGQQ